MITETTVPPSGDDDNVYDEVNHNDAVERPEEEYTDEDDTEEAADEDDTDSADHGEADADDEEDEEPVEAFPVEKPVAKVLSCVAIPSNAGGLNQRHIDVRWGITDNSTRTSRLRPDAKHLTIKLPDILARLFTGVWVAEGDDGEAYIDFFARSDQEDRSGFKGGAWRWMKIKPNGEVAIAINRTYTKSRCDGVLVRDYVLGAFKLDVPIDPDAGTPQHEAID